jgi:hypothetical protein
VREAQKENHDRRIGEGFGCFRASRRELDTGVRRYDESDFFPKTTAASVVLVSSHGSEA